MFNKAQRRASSNAAPRDLSVFTDYYQYTSDQDDVSDTPWDLPRRTNLLTQDDWEKHVFREVGHDVKVIYHHFGHDGTGDLVEPHPGYTTQVVWRFGRGQPLILRHACALIVLYPNGRVVKLMSNETDPPEPSFFDKFVHQVKSLLKRRE
ncbi:hypothetical protein ONZ45_g637 [Pleurotus djamor]|nr:hypothetical protein ONZ45_g637 [Pleurotus djamor]